MHTKDIRFTLEATPDRARERCLVAISALGRVVRRDLSQHLVIFCYVPVRPHAPVYSISLYPDKDITHVVLLAMSDECSQSHADRDLPKLKRAILIGDGEEASSVSSTMNNDQRSRSVKAQSHAKCFISYRRYDSADVVGRIYDRLVAVYGEDRIFKDFDNIPMGMDFRKVLEDAVSACAVLLVVIERDWLTVADRHGQRRFDAPADFVRLEIETAFTRGIPAVQVLVRDAVMPREEERLNRSVN